MFTRGVEVITKPGKTREVADTIQESARPILRKQPGFVDAIVLVSDTEADHILALSFWNTKEDAECFHREEYPTLYGLLAHLIEIGVASSAVNAIQLVQSQNGN
jgi:Antibiotic biosynthesis monooxygenase